jgi:methionyl-tRNA formyltransferase
MNREVDQLDRILDKLSQRIDEWDDAQAEAAEAEARLKSQEATTAKAMIDSGMSAAKAQQEVRAKTEWREMYLEAQYKNIAAQKVKMQIELGNKYFEAERTRQANLRGIR